MMGAMNHKHTHPAQQLPPAPRLFFLDWLRILAFALLVPYHVGMYYVSWDWHIKSPHASTALEPLMQLASPWRLSLLFFIAGAVLQIALRQRADAGGLAFIGRRSRRLLWPLLFGMLVVVPPQAYFEVVEQVQYAGSYIDFMRLYLVAYAGFCDADGCLTLPTWNHLWFLPYLLVYTLLAWGLLRAAPQLLDRLAARLGRAGTPMLLLGLALPLMLARLTLLGFETTHNLVWDWYNHAQSLSAFMLGLLLARSEVVWARLADLRWSALLLALAAWGLRMGYFSFFAEPEPAALLVGALRLLYGAMQWWAIAAACGFAYRHLNVDGPLRRALSPAIFCLYILHQTVIILLARALLPLQLAPLGEGLLLIALTLLVCGLAYLLLRRLPPALGLLLGIHEQTAAKETREPATFGTISTARKELQ